MPESLLNHRFRGTTLPYEDLLIALENKIIDKVTTHSALKVKNIDTSAPMEIGMAAGRTDGQCTRAQEPKVWLERRKGSQLECTETLLSTVAKVRKERILLERDSGPRLEARKARERRHRSDQSLLELQENMTNCGKLRQGELKQEPERCRGRQRRHQCRRA